MSSAAVKAAQQQMNEILVAQGFLPINADGIVGPKTCGAARAVNHPALTDMTCTSFTAPARAPGGPPIPPPGPGAPPAPFSPGPVGPLAPAPEPAKAGIMGIDTKTILIGAAVVGVGIVAVYALKRKSQAAA